MEKNLKTVKYAEDARCWAVAIEVMNHFYGGNLTQDEIVYHTKFAEGDPLLSPFNDDGNFFDDLNSPLKYPMGNLGGALKWALHTNSLNYSKGAPSYATVKKAIDSNRLVYVTIPYHAMVIYGYVGDSDNYAFYYAFGDNDGHIANSLYKDKAIEQYLIPDVTYGDVEMSDERVYLDSDDDGITNFEEEERFHTNPYLADSDNDGIEDKREIYNYLRSEHLENAAHLAYNPYDDVKRNDKGLTAGPYQSYMDFDSFYNTADRNKNHVLAELDPDDDDDGIEDGLKGRFDVINMDVPEEYTIFGREFVKFNDGVKCYDSQTESNSYCNIGASDENIFSYDISYAPISIGARAHVGNIDVRSEDFGIEFPGEHSNPVLRSSSVVHGNVNIYGVPNVVKDFMDIFKKVNNMDSAKAIYLKSRNVLDYISIQNGSSIEGNISLAYASTWSKRFTFAYTTAMPTILESRIKIVRNGEIYRLKNGDKFNKLQVQSGGTLIIEPGEMFIASLFQVDADATIRFAEPGKGTVLHTNGQIIWHKYKSEPMSNAQYWINVAKGFKLAHHSSQKIFAEGVWAGTIFAPKAKVVMGQVTKTIYGRILARSVVIHQYSKVYRVDFSPTDAMQVACNL